MAITKLNESCGICKCLLPVGEQIIYITKVKLAAHDIGRHGKSLPMGKLRIINQGSSNPRVGVHLKCYEEKIAGLLSDVDGKKADRLRQASNVLGPQFGT